MLRVLGSVMRHHACAHVAGTWSRAVVTRQQMRLIHQSVTYLVSQNDTKESTDTELLMKTEESSENIATDHNNDFQRNLDSEDTFGTLTKSPEFKEPSDEKHVEVKKLRNFRSDKAFHEQKAAYNSDDVDLQDWRGSSNNFRNKKVQEFDGNSDFSKRKQNSEQTSGGFSSAEDNVDKPWKNRPEDQFGLLATEGDEELADLLHDRHDEMHEIAALQEEKDTKPHIPLGTYNRKHVPDWYARRIQKLGREGKVKEAIKVFDKWMIMEDRVKPTVYEFELLIQIVGNVGYTQKAFKLYNQMTKLGIKDWRSPHIYTSLFNACSKSPWPEDGLMRARKLRNHLLVRGYKPAYETYNAMIQAFGRCGDLNTAFLLADEAEQVTPNLLNSLLTACLSDQEAGFRHAILVWRKMKQMGVSPDTYSYNLLMSVVKDCGIGNLEFAKDILIDAGNPRDQLPAGKKASRRTKEGKAKNLAIKKRENLFADIDDILNKYTDDKKATEKKDFNKVNPADSGTLGITEHDDQNIVQEAPEQIDIDQEEEIECAKPDNVAWWQMDIFSQSDNESSQISSSTIGISEDQSVLDPDTKCYQSLSLDKVKTREDRLALIGGYSKILRAMQPSVQPNLSFFTTCLASVPAKQEEDFLNQMLLANVKPDVTFYNMLIKKRADRKDFKGAKKVIKMMEESNIAPDILTFGCYAKCCTTKKEGLELLKTMEEVNIEPNGPILSALMFAAKVQFEYLKTILFEMERYGVRPDRKTINLIESKIVFAKKLLSTREKEPRDYFNAEAFSVGLDRFINIYEKWLRRMELATEDHPWAPFIEKKDKKESRGKMK